MENNPFDENNIADMEDFLSILDSLESEGVIIDIDMPQINR